MCSSLTRNVFKAIIANEPYCVTTFSRNFPKQRCRLFSQPTVPSSQRRSFFGLSARSSIESVLDNRKTLSDVEKASKVLVSLVRAQRDQTQLPSIKQIVLAFTSILQYRKRVPAHLSRNEIYLLTEGFKYAQDQKVNEVGDAEETLSDADLQQALSILVPSSARDRFRSDSKALAFMLFSVLRQRRQARGESVDALTTSDPLITETYIKVLSSTGGAREAWDVLRNSSEGDVQTNWIEVFKGLLNEGLEQDIWKALTEMRSRTGDLTFEHWELLICYFARNDSTGATKKMYEQKKIGGGAPTIMSLVEIVELCIRNKELSWAEPILDNLRSHQQDPRVWNVILVSYAAQGATANDLTLIMDNWMDNAIDTDTSGPTMSNINSLVEYAFSVGDAQGADEYIEIARERGLQPDAKTALLRLGYEVKIGDLDRAASTYGILLCADPIADGSDVPVLNSFLRAVCFSSDPNYDILIRLLEAASDKEMYLEAETVGGLCKVYLERDELGEVLELIRNRVDSYPRDDRARISQTFKEFITSEGVADQRAFNAYELFRAAFPETSVEDRLPLMDSFFRRKRPDLACLVFGHMRQREDSTGRPTPQAYGRCFEGIAKCQDIDGLQMVYNMLKLDLQVEPTARVQNGLMAAYTACEQPFTAIIDHFWKILGSTEGPTLSSFALALRACETWIPQGATEARRIMAMMQSWDVEITKQIYDCYVGAIAGQCEFENTIELIEEMENDIGVAPDAFT